MPNFEIYYLASQLQHVVKWLPEDTTSESRLLRSECAPFFLNEVIWLPNSELKGRPGMLGLGWSIWRKACHVMENPTLCFPQVLLVALTGGDVQLRKTIRKHWEPVGDIWQEGEVKKFGVLAE